MLKTLRVTKQNFLHPQEAERSIRFFRNIQADKSNDDDNAPTDQLKIEFESLKSLLSEHSSGNSVTVKDFRKFFGSPMSAANLNFNSNSLQ